MDCISTRVRNSYVTFAERTGLRRQLIDTLFSLVGVNLLIAGVSFVTTMAIANVLGREAFGDLAFGIAVGTYGLMFVQYGFEKSLVRELVHFPERFGELLKGSLLLRLLLFGLFLLVAVVFFVGRPGCSRGMVLVILATVLPAFQIAAAYDAWRRMSRHAVYFLIERGAYFLLVWAVILVPFLSLSLEGVGILMLASVLLGLLLQYRWAWPRVDFRPVQGTAPALVFLLRSNLFIWLAVLSGLSIEYLSQIMLKWYAGSSELGTYSVAWRITQLGILFLSQAGRIGAEATARHTRPDRTAGERLRFLVKYTALMAAIGFTAGLPCLLSPRLLLMIFRPEYAGAAESLRVLGLYPLFYGPYLVALQYVISSRMQKTYFALITMAGFLSVGFNLCLIPMMQSQGAAISVVVSLAVALGLFAAAVGWHLRSLIKPVPGRMDGIVSSAEA